MITIRIEYNVAYVRMKNKTVSKLYGSSPIISAGKWSKMALLLKKVTDSVLSQR